MYGFVNQAIRDFVIENQGEDVWPQIVSKAGITDACFVPNTVYDDSVTYCLVGAIANHLGVSLPQALEVFGEYWISFVDDRGFGALLSGNGKTLKEFLSNLDQFHSRLSTAYPEFNPPDFEFSDLGDGKIELIYKSRRPGLAPMVTGILRGLAKRYGTEIDLVSQCHELEGRFLITIVNQPVSAGS